MHIKEHRFILNNIFEGIWLFSQKNGLMALEMLSEILMHNLKAHANVV